MLPPHNRTLPLRLLTWSPLKVKHERGLGAAAARRRRRATTSSRSKTTPSIALNIHLLTAAAPHQRTSRCQHCAWRSSGARKQTTHLSSSRHAGPLAGSGKRLEKACCRTSFRSCVFLAVVRALAVACWSRACGSTWWPASSRNFSEEICVFVRLGPKFSRLRRRVRRANTGLYGCACGGLKAGPPQWHLITMTADRATSLVE